MNIDKILFFLLFTINIAQAQQLTVVNSTVLGPGLEYQRLSDANNQILHALIINPKLYNIIPVRSASPMSLEQLANNNSALAAINGGFFRTDPTNNENLFPAGLLKINHLLVSPAYKLRGAVGWNDSNKNILFDRIKKNKHTINPTLNKDTKQLWNQFDHIVGGGPLLIYNNKLITDYSVEHLAQGFVEEPNARTAFGIRNDGTWIMLVAEYNPLLNSNGLTIPELASIMAELNCNMALNLDGGGSASMFTTAESNPDQHILRFNHIIDHAIIIKPRSH